MELLFGIAIGAATVGLIWAFAARTNDAIVRALGLDLRSNADAKALKKWQDDEPWA